ncbi:hypothetical protein lacNasYZ02_00650 [Lactobacillus nasalidis]|nr:hypothetical protein lacNasYZ02_00650 [Lactobacillus nasalidis]
MGNALIKIGDALFFVVILHCIQVYQALPVSRDQAWIPFFIILEGAQAIEDFIFGINAQAFERLIPYLENAELCPGLYSEA